jgi:retron-type reverse transcriptase
MGNFRDMTRVHLSGEWYGLWNDLMYGALSHASTLRVFIPS